MDDFQVRATGNLQARHEKAIAENARRIQKHIGYVLARIEDGGTATVGHYARGIAADAHEIESRIAVLEGIGEALGIIEAAGPEAGSPR
jgi:hypothetical protein